MKNDYKKSDFFKKKIKDKNTYFIKVNNQWINVSKEVFHVCRNSYMKIYRDSFKYEEKLVHYNEELIYTLINDTYEFDPEKILNKQEQIHMIHSALSILTDEERFLIKEIYFFGCKEVDVAKKLRMSQQLVNYKKKKILKKLRDFLLKQI